METPSLSSKEVSVVNLIEECDALRAQRDKYHSQRNHWRTEAQKAFKVRDELRAEVERLRAALEIACYDLVTSDGLYACDNEEGHSLFRLEQLSLVQVKAALGAGDSNEQCDMDRQQDNYRNRL